MMYPALLLWDGHGWVGKGEWVIAMRGERKDMFRFGNVLLLKQCQSTHNCENINNTYVPGWDGGKNNSFLLNEVNPHDLVLAKNHYRLWRLWLWHLWQLGGWHIIATPQGLVGLWQLAILGLEPHWRAKTLVFFGWFLTTEDLGTSRYWQQHCGWKWKLNPPSFHFHKDPDLWPILPALILLIPPLLTLNLLALEWQNDVLSPSTPGWSPPSWKRGQE